MIREVHSEGAMGYRYRAQIVPSRRRGKEGWRFVIQRGFMSGWDYDRTSCWFPCRCSVEAAAHAALDRLAGTDPSTLLEER